MESNRDLYELLIRMDEGQKFLIARLEDIDERLKEADKNRNKLREDIYKVTEDVFIVGQTVAQHRDVLTALNEKIENNHEEIKPVLENVKILKMLRRWVLGAAVALGITGATVWLWAKEWLMVFITWLQKG